jgi:hypothetical protein
VLVLQVVLPGAGEVLEEEPELLDDPVRSHLPMAFGEDDI